MFLDLIELSRPKHWLKNAFVLMPIPFALASGASLEPRMFLLGFFGFCLANSAVYAFNDAYDAERDRKHPEKRRRPVASGRIARRTALLWSAGLLSLGALFAHASGAWRALAILLLYAVFNLIYSVRGKHIPLLDVFLLSSGFVLRVLLGCALVEVAPSNWLMLCSSGLALFLALAKRRGDLHQGLDREHRPSLAGYNLAFLEQAMVIMTATTLMSYALYCMEAEILIPGREFASLPFVLFGILEYLRVVHVKSDGGSPVETLLGSPEIILCGLGWLIATLWSLGLP